MIHEVGDGLGLRKVLSNGVEVDRSVVRCDTQTGECVVLKQPLQAVDGEAAKETIFLENVSVEFIAA